MFIWAGEEDEIFGTDEIDDGRTKIQVEVAKFL
jgi:hypothetical protein